MNRWNHLSLAAAFALALTAQSGSIANAEVASKADEKRGFWWKKAPPPPEAESEQGGTEQYPDLPPPPPEAELDKLHPKQVEQLIGDYRAYAVWKNTPEHVEWYFQLQDFARRKAVAFMNTTELVMLTRSDLNVNTQYPATTPGRDARVRMREESINRRLASDRSAAAIVLLTRQGCEYCEAQRSALKYFQEKHGWEIKEVDIGENPQVAARFATDYVPTTVVIFRGSDEWRPVAVGVESVPRIEEGIYRSLRLHAGETTPEQYTVKEEEDGGVFDPTRRLR
jgi:conjugal transfer pilus assembly protein TraF